MGTMTKSTWMKKAAALAIAPAAILSVAACSDTAGSEQGADVEDVNEAAEEDNEQVAEGDDAYVGVYDQAWYDDQDSHVGEEVTLSADVNEVVDPTAFTIAGTDDTTVDELLIVHPEDLPEVSTELTVAVTGTVKEGFDLVTVEEDLGVDLDDALYEDWDGKTYVHATEIDDSVASDT
ncbi:hypothetical protein [Arthrobacter sp. Ld5]|uniref:hypothetical protein n=1 Tax=Arthrobacter sp. Ld5 TaxID=649152 RepID=UPI003EBAE7C5